jgi:D-glycero-alpha-D-manno-heptose-7-phosphate kinase
MATVRVRAPVRVLDAGGWTDTWFAKFGAVCNVAAEPGVEVIASQHEPAKRHEADTVDVRLASFAEHYRLDLGESLPGRHPLVEAAIRRWAPRGRRLSVEVTSSVPPGSGLGTSASVVVGLIVALRALAGRTPGPLSLSQAAHVVESEDVGLHSGIQDQIAASYGGASLITIDRYPEADVQPLDLAPATWDVLERRMLTVYLGEARSSSAVHEAVITRLGSSDAEGRLAPLRSAARHAAAALIAGKIHDYGQALIANTEAQAALHPDLVNAPARSVIEIARRHEACGWKVNGAGGTVTVISSHDPAGLRDELCSVHDLRVLSLRPAREGARIIGH